MKPHQEPRLTEEKQIGPFASLKDKAESKVGAFNDYDCLYAHMVAVTRLKYYEDLVASNRMIVLPEDMTILDLQQSLAGKSSVTDVLDKILSDYIAK